MESTSEEIEAFVQETEEGLALLDQAFVTLERDPSNLEALSRAFRVMHTIKGTSRCLDLKKIEQLGHAAEGLLAHLRDGRLRLDPARATVLLKVVDALRAMIVTVKACGNEGNTVLDEMMTALGASMPDPAEAGVAPGPRETSGDGSRVDEAADQQAALDRVLSAGVVETSIRVDVPRLNQFMSAVGELVLIRNQIVQQASGGRVPSDEMLQRLSTLTKLLQKGVLKVRLQPIGRLWANLPRVVRDLAASLGKEVDLTVQGGETELDRAVLEIMRDPLLHAVRNALDHGFEAPEARVHAGKPRRGRLSVRAWHGGGLVHIAIEDDGAGVNLEKVRAKGIERGFLDPAQAAMASDGELLELLFLPGFSTVDAVTRLSGRGVGMDVVRSALERAGGSVQMTSRAGQGATLTMTMPLTLAIVAGLIVRSGDHQYAIPQASLEEVVRVEGTEDFHGLPVLRLRGSLIPLVDLARLFGVRADDGAALAGFAAIVRTDGRTLGLVVDEVHDMQEIVVKPLPRWFRASRCFSGLAILGDGSVAVILDAAGLRRRARVGAATADRDVATARRLPAATGALKDRVLLVGDGRGGRQALWLRDVVRIEQAPRSTIESLDGSPVIQYGGSVLRLIDLCPWAPRRDPVNVLVTTVDGRLTGLIVDEVLDIGPAALRQGTSVDGREIVVINGQVASLQDLRQILARDSSRTGPSGAGVAA